MNSPWQTAAEVPDIPDPREWRTRAACLDVDADEFTPAVDYDVVPDHLKAFCAACPVWFACLQDALKVPTGGVRAGTTEAERRRMGAGPVRMRRGKAAHTYDGSTRRRAS